MEYRERPLANCLFQYGISAAVIGRFEQDLENLVEPLIVGRSHRYRHGGRRAAAEVGVAAVLGRDRVGGDRQGRR